MIALDSLLTSTGDNLSHLLWDNPSFRFLQTNVSKGEHLLARLMKEVGSGSIDYVLHLASPSTPTLVESMAMEILEAGAQGTKAALELARYEGATFLMASTSEVYGDPLVHPQPETYTGNIDHTSVRGVYAEAKRYAEALTMTYHRKHGLDTRIVRIFNAYGPRMKSDDGRMMPTFVEQALHGWPLTVQGNGRQTRSPCYVSDIVAGILALLRSPIVKPINIGNDAEHTILDVAESVLRITQSKSRIEHEPNPHEDAPKRRCPDLTCARTLLGYEPKVSLEGGIAETVRFAKRRILRSA